MSDSSSRNESFINRFSRAGRAAFRTMVREMEENFSSPALGNRNNTPKMSSTPHSTSSPNLPRNNLSGNNTLVRTPSPQQTQQTTGLSPIAVSGSAGHDCSRDEVLGNEGLTDTLVADQVVNRVQQELLTDPLVTEQVANRVQQELNQEIGRQLNTTEIQPPDDPYAIIQTMVDRAVAERTRQLDIRENELQEALQKLHNDRKTLEEEKITATKDVPTQVSVSTTHNTNGSNIMERKLQALEEQMSTLQSTLNRVTDPTHSRTSLNSEPISATSHLNPSACQFVPVSTFSSIYTLPSSTVVTSSITSTVSSLHQNRFHNIPQTPENNEFLQAWQQFLEQKHKSNLPISSSSAPQIQENVLDTLNKLAPHGIYNSRPMSTNTERHNEPFGYPSRNIPDLHPTLRNSHISSNNPLPPSTIIPPSTQQLDNSVMHNLSTLIATRLPTIEIEKFTGDVKRYETFKTKFKTLMASTNATPEEQARTLYQSLGGDVVTQLDHIPNLCDSGAYERLWQSLDSEFGRFHNGAQDYVNDLTARLQTWPLAKSSNDVSALYKFLRSYNTTLELERQEHEMETSHIRKLILGTLTGHLKGRIIKLIDDNNNSQKPIIKQILEEMKTATRLISLDENARGAKTSRPMSRVNFLGTSEEEEIFTSQINRVESRDARSTTRSVRFEEPPVRSENTRLDSQGLIRSNRIGNERFGNQYSSQTRSHLRSPTRQSNGISDIHSRNRNSESLNRPSSPRLSDPNYILEREQRFSRKCLFCCTDDHESEACDRLSSPQEYKDILYKYRLCFNCHHQNHGNLSCLLPKRCTKSCADSTKHSTVVCTQSQ